MSTTIGAIGGKERRGILNFWILILTVAILLLGINFYFSTRYAQQEADARDIVATIQVQSQQIAKFAQEAAAGGLESFGELEGTRSSIQNNLNRLAQGDPETGLPSFAESLGGVSAANELAALQTAWSSIDENAARILDRRELIVNLADSASAFSASVPQLQGQMDEVVRAMTDGGAAPTQITIANRQLILADRMLRYVTQILQGGAAATSAADRFSRDYAMFGNVLTGLDAGSAEQGIRRLDAPAGRAALARVAEAFAGVRLDVESILGGATDLFEVKEASDSIFRESEELLERARALGLRISAMAGERTFPSLIIGVIAAALAVFALIGLLLTIYRDQARRFSVTQELNQRNQEAILRLLDEMGSLAEGDLTVRATVTEDITGAIADSINFAVEALRSLVTTINETAVQVAAAAQETQATAMHLAEAAEHQAQQITSASAAINEIAVSIDEVSKNSAESADVAQRSVQIAAKGAEVVRQTIQGMDSIRDQIQETSKRIKRLGESSQEIGSIVELINDIAEQTNILALNAAIQAASAGEAGRGFAVVADEVQRLAERASNATKRIETLVQTIQADTNEAVSSMEQTTAEVVAGARLAEDAGLALGEIEKVSNDLADLIQNISEAARQQSAAATNISATMNVIQEITTQTSMGASQTAESIGNLAQLAADLRRSVADFKLPG
ncbi:methyl-accepting chemotaxis protein [Aquimonas voraii]|uniref:Twitching motility protein PilJ n=1 Tax=Aquimonas voraii TaxID=265719 RepID=A0A1G6SWK7_9GAMM|nr:methyl-accepting chemotaxis protein [Aquimonas voraii]SDD21153.1 twitching motility protein PilJ [Aquimonas voraii]